MKTIAYNFRHSKYFVTKKINSKLVTSYFKKTKNEITRIEKSFLLENYDSFSECDRKRIGT